MGGAIITILKIRKLEQTFKTILKKSTTQGENRKANSQVERASVLYLELKGNSSASIVYNYDFYFISN